MSPAGIHGLREVIEMNGCGCGCCGGRPGATSWPAREDRIRSLEEYQRDLEQRAAAVADEIRTLKEGPQSAT